MIIIRARGDSAPSACVESYVGLFRFQQFFGFLRSRRCVIVRKRRIATRGASLDDPKMEEGGVGGLDSLSFYGRCPFFRSGVHFSNLRLIYEIRG